MIENKEKRIIVFGGSFNPPHNGHVLLIRDTLKHIKCDKALIIPSADRRDKVIQISGDQRLTMVRMMVAECLSDLNVSVEVSDTELLRNKPTTTFDTKCELEEQYPDSIIYFVGGTDAIGEVREKWVHGEDLYKNGNFIAFPRAGVPTPKELPLHTIILKPEEVGAWELSSTSIRQMIQKGESIDTLVPKSIVTHIYKNHLYV